MTTYFITKGYDFKNSDNFKEVKGHLVGNFATPDLQSRCLIGAHKNSEGWVLTDIYTGFKIVDKLNSLKECQNWFEEESNKKAYLEVFNSDKYQNFRKVFMKNFEKRIKW